LLHSRPTQPFAFHGWIQPFQRADEVRAVHIARGLTGDEKHFHTRPITPITVE
jgi:hypothetical protein